MVRQGLPLAAVLFLGTLLPVLAGPDEDADARLRNQLAVQVALQQGRDNLKRGNYQAAVYCLEDKIAHVNGNRDYINALREAYRGYIRELQQSHRDAEVPTYVRRLQVIDPGAALEMGTVRPSLPAMTARPTAPSAPESKEPAAPARAPETLADLAARPEPVSNKPNTALADPSSLGILPRGQKPEDDPFGTGNRRQLGPAQRLLQQASQEFSRGHYRSAGQLFEQVHRADAQATEPCRDLWAFCKYSTVVEQLNRLTEGTSPPPELEQEVRLAMSMSSAPRLNSFGKDLLQRLHEGGAPQITVRHGQPSQGWTVAETDNFRVMHMNSPELAEKVARVAETTRATMARKWFGDNPPRWTPQCYVYIYPNKEDYARATGVPASTPGHSSFEFQGSQIMRRMDMRADEPHMLDSVLPHETTHVVLAGRFGRHQVPRWMDEGVAVLTEPRPRIYLHLRNLPQHRSDGILIPLAQLLRMDKYPEPRYIGTFYAQSVSLCEYLSTLPGGPRTFTHFVRDGLDQGYEAALRRHYGIQSIAELEQRWQAHAFGNGESARASAQ
jgi:hypothetical protein